MSFVKNFSKLVLLTAWATASVAWADLQIIDSSPVMADYVASNPGLETVLPFIKRVDSNGDKEIDQVQISFNVYKAGTTTKLFSTSVKTYPALKSPCVNPIWEDGDRTLEFKRLGDAWALISTQAVYCQEAFGSNEQSVYSTYVYAADVTASGKTVWSKLIGQEIDAAGVLADMNDNGFDELNVLTSNGKGLITVYVYDGKTGASLVKPASYTVDK